MQLVTAIAYVWSECVRALLYAGCCGLCVWGRGVVRAEDVDEPKAFQFHQNNRTAGCSEARGRKQQRKHGSAQAKGQGTGKVVTKVQTNFFFDYLLDDSIASLHHRTARLRRRATHDYCTRTAEANGTRRPTLILGQPLIFDVGERALPPSHS